MNDRRPRPLRVLWVIKGLGPGGAEHLLVSAARIHDPEAFRLEVAYLLPWKDALVDELVAAGVKVHPLEVPRPVDPRWARRLRRMVREGDFDVVHFHSPLVASVGRLAVRSLGRGRPAVVTTEHNVWGSFALPTRWANALTYGLDDATIAVSPEVEHSVYRPLRRRVEVVVHGVDLDDVGVQAAERDEVRRELGVAPGEVLVGTVANLRAKKAYPDLFEAARRVIDDDPAVRFVAVGQGPLEAELRALHAELGLGERFRMLGYRPDAVRVMAGCDVFALASHHEGYPVALMEALALGLPVVATAVGGVPDAVREGVEGRLVPPGRPDLLAAALAEVTGDVELRKRMSEAARERSARFDIRRAVRRLEEVYTALGRPGS